ncbi:glycosyltransferase [Desulfatiglans anilini]|uniref:glycosyltransferase n=1 Tax=Desulfatiglans anilini TaxID=90728 RepID=UPI0003F798AC|nr:glycosyltransferase [Desulfatiglans anilini]
MRITYVCRSFLDYRVPVFETLDELVEGRLSVVFSDKIPERVIQRARNILGERAVGLAGERALGFHGNITSEFSNTRLRIPWQPGILREIRKSKPHVLIGDGFSQWTLAALVYRIVEGIPLVVCYERTTHTERNAQWYRRIFRKAVIAFVDAMCVNGSLSRGYARSLGMSEDRITIGHMVADVKELHNKHKNLQLDQVSALRQSLGIPLDAVVFLSVSKLIKLKGIAEFLEGWKRFAWADNAKPHLLVVGDGPERGNLEAICREANLRNVTFAGAIDYSHIHQYYGLADVFVISTLEDNWSLVVPEAMACGLPIMCSRYNGCWPELVTPENGWVFDPLDSMDTVSCLEKCLAGRDRLPEMGRKSFEIVQNHTPDHAAKAILNACRIALKR